MIYNNQTYSSVFRCSWDMLAASPIYHVHVHCALRKCASGVNAASSVAGHWKGSVQGGAHGLSAWCGNVRSDGTKTALCFLPLPSVRAASSSSESIICVCPAVVNRYQLEEKLKYEHHRRPVKPSRQLFHPLLVHTNDLKAS